MLPATTLTATIIRYTRSPLLVTDVVCNHVSCDHHTSSAPTLDRDQSVTRDHCRLWSMSPTTDLLAIALWVNFLILSHCSAPKKCPDALLASRTFQRYPIWLYFDEKIFVRNFFNKILLHHYSLPSPLVSAVTVIIGWPKIVLSCRSWLACRLR